METLSEIDYSTYICICSKCHHIWNAFETDEFNFTFCYNCESSKVEAYDVFKLNENTYYITKDCKCVILSSSLNSKNNPKNITERELDVVFSLMPEGGIIKTDYGIDIHRITLKNKYPKYKIRRLWKH